MRGEREINKGEERGGEGKGGGGKKGNGRMGEKERLQEPIIPLAQVRRFTSNSQHTHLFIPREVFYIEPRAPRMAEVM